MVLREAFRDISPITDYSGQYSLEFVDFQFCKNDLKYSIEECKERDATYAAPLRVKVRLRVKDAPDMPEYEIFMGDLPLMTETGTFVINVQLFRTEGHGWSTRLIPTMYSMSVLIELEKYQ